MPIQMCPIDIPEGWEFVRVGIVQPGERYIRIDGQVGTATETDERHEVVRVIIRPALQVGDWVRVVHHGGHTDGKRGVIHDCSKCVIGSYMVSIKGVGSLYYQRENLIKQTRTVKPYDLSECIAASTRLDTLGVRAGRCETVIESFHIAGVTVANQDMSFVSYVEAARSLAWRGGEAFGIEAWEDAK